MHQDVGIGLVGHGAGAAAFPDEPSHCVGPGAVPEGLEVISIIPEAAHGLVVTQGAACPDVAVRGQVGIGDAGVAGDDLAVFPEDADGQRIVDQTKRMGDSLEQHLSLHVGFDLLHEKIDGRFILIRIRGDGIGLVEHLRALLRNLVPVAVGAEPGDEGGDPLDVVDVPSGDHRAELRMESGMVRLQGLETVEQRHDLLEIAGNAPDLVVLFAEMIEAGLDREADMGTTALQV